MHFLISLLNKTLKFTKVKFDAVSFSIHFQKGHNASLFYIIRLTFASVIYECMKII